MGAFFSRFGWFFLLIFISFTNSENPFNYDLHITRIPGTSGKIMVCMHGKGGDYSIAHNVKECSGLSDTFVGFNFPDYGIRAGQKKIDEICYGTVDEILPAIYVLKKLIIDEGQTEINLYGFSAGGGALINLIGALNTPLHDKSLKKIAVYQKEKEKILAVICQGNIILDTPLKSVREIVHREGAQSKLVPFEKRYRENGMEPIDSLQFIDNLVLNVWLHFQKPDEILSNRDDELYIERLKKYNALGKNHIVIGYDAGHKIPHPTLWKAYLQENEQLNLEKQEKKHIVGIKTRTSNIDAKEDIKLLWERFRKENIFGKIPNKLSDNIYLIYTDYEKDFTRPYSCVIGCEVSPGHFIPQGMCQALIEEGDYITYQVEGTHPVALMKTWEKIWKGSALRAYRTDFELYPVGFHEENSQGLSVHIGIKQ